MLDFLATWGELIVLAAQILFAWFMWSMRQSFATKKDHHALEKTVGEHSTTLLLQQQTLAGVPTDGDLHEMSEKMGEMHRQSSVTAATVEGISEQLKGISHQVSQLNTYLLNRTMK